MSLYLGRSSSYNKPLLHLAKSGISYNDIKSGNFDAAHTVLISNMDLYSLDTSYTLSYTGTSNLGAKQFYCPVDLSNIYSSSSSIILIMSKINGSWYASIPASLSSLPQSVSVQNFSVAGLSYSTIGNTVNVFSSVVPSDVVVHKFSKYSFVSNNEILINKNNFIVDGANFSIKFLSISSSQIVVSDTYYSTPYGYINIHNSSGLNTSWFMNGTSIGRTDINGNINYFANSNYSNFKSFGFLGKSSSQNMTFSKSMSSYLFVAINSPVIDGESNSSSQYVVRNYTSIFCMDSSMINYYHLSGYPIYSMSLPLGASYMWRAFYCNTSSISTYYSLTRYPSPDSIVSFTPDNYGEQSYAVFTL